MSITKEAIEALHQRIKDLAANSTPDQLAYLAKSLELIIDKKAISDIVQMTKVKEIIDALQGRLKDLAANSTPDQLAYLAKALESIVDKSAVSDIVYMTDEKLKELLSAARSHLNEINTNKENSISAITVAKTESVNEINTLKANTLDTLKASSSSHISLLDTRKDANIAAINSVGNDHKDGLKGLVDNFRAVNNVPPGSSIIGEIETRDEQLKASLINEMKTQDEQLKASIVNETKTREEQLKTLKNTFEVISDPDILLKTINDNNLETWLSNTDNQRKFKKMLSNANAVLNITGYYPALDKLIRSPKAIQALMESGVALNIIAHTTAISILLNSEEVIKVMVASASAVNVMISLKPSVLAIEAIASSGIALHAIVHSELACKAIGSKIWHYRSTVVSTLEASSSLFRKQAGVRIGDGATTQESGRGSATIYIPVSCHDDNDTRFYVNSLIENKNLLDIYKHSGERSITVGIVLRGVQVRGEGGSVGYVTFDIYTAI